MTAPSFDSSVIRHHSSLRLSIALSVSLVMLAATWGWTQSQTSSSTPSSQTKIDSKINEPFRKPNVKEYVKKFESQERETYSKRHEIVAALGLTKGMTVADVGAGTGLFTRLIAEGVGPTGKVYAVDIAPRFLEHIAAESKKRRQTQVVTVLCNQDTTNLARESVDLAFLCDVYHHLEKPEKTLASIRRALKAGGSLVVVEFDRVEGRSAEFVLKHVRAGKDVFRKEIETAGFTVIPTAKSPSLKENFFLRFHKTTSEETPRDQKSDRSRPRRTVIQ
jgi:ubiquinone/menaquinone biosynthesis C-methylase UbiE